jgi:hypothetical protein
MDRSTNPFLKVWFWVLIISIILFIVSFAMFETYGQTPINGNSETPIWVWVMFAIAFVFWIAALVLYAIDYSSYKRKLAIAEACGELLPPPPKPKMECPKKKCTERRVTEVVVTKPCATEIVTTTKPCDKPQPKPCDTPQPKPCDTPHPKPCDIVAPTPVVEVHQTPVQVYQAPAKAVTISNGNVALPDIVSAPREQAFSAAAVGMKPLSSLAPPSSPNML